jgi:hypothetical protein
MSKFDKDLGILLREEAIDRVEEAADDAWKKHAVGIITGFPAGTEFTSDDVWAHVGDPPGDPRAMGAVMRTVRLSGLAEITDRMKVSNRPINHRRKSSRSGGARPDGHRCP